MVRHGRPCPVPPRPGPRRPGHSIPELIVAMTFLAATVVAVGGTAVLGERVSARAVARQAAVRLAAAVVDSVARAPTVSPGRRSENGLTAVWGPDPGSDAVRVTVAPTAGGPPLVSLYGRTVPDVMTLPDENGNDPGAMP